VRGVKRLAIGASRRIPQARRLSAAEPNACCICSHDNFRRRPAPRRRKGAGVRGMEHAIVRSPEKLANPNSHLVTQIGVRNCGVPRRLCDRDAGANTTAAGWNTAPLCTSSLRECARAVPRCGNGLLLRDG